MDFKSILNKLDSMSAPVVTPAAPVVEKAVQLNEDAQLRVLSGRTTYVAEAKKKAEEDVKEEMKVGDKKASSTGGTIEKTKTGIKHTAGKNYGGDKAPKDEEDEPTAKKAKKVKEGAEAAARSKFVAMVEAKKGEAGRDAIIKQAEKDTTAKALKQQGNTDQQIKRKISKTFKEGSKPDFLDMDKDGDKKEPMKSAAKDAKKGAAPKKGVNPFAKKEAVKEEMKVGDKKKSATGGTIEKTATGIKHTAGKNYSGKTAEKEAKSKKDESVTRSKKVVAESVQPNMSFRDMMKLVVESGGQQQIDPLDKELFAWATRVAQTKFVNESMKAEVYAGMTYERMGGTFQMFDVLSED